MRVHNPPSKLKQSNILLCKGTEELIDGFFWLSSSEEKDIMVYFAVQYIND